MGSCPERARFRHGWRKYHGGVPGKQRFQARVVSFMWGRTRKGLVLGMGGQFHVGSYPKRARFRHGWRKYHGIEPGKQRFHARVVSFMWVEPGKQRFQARVGSFMWGRTRKATFLGTGGQFHVGRARKATFLGTGGGNTIGSCPESNVFRHG